MGTSDSKHLKALQTGKFTSLFLEESSIMAADFAITSHRIDASCNDAHLPCLLLFIVSGLITQVMLQHGLTVLAVEKKGLLTHNSGV